MDAIKNEMDELIAKRSELLRKIAELREEVETLSGLQKRACGVAVREASEYGLYMMGPSSPVNSNATRVYVWFDVDNADALQTINGYMAHAPNGSVSAAVRKVDECETDVQRISEALEVFASVTQEQLTKTFIDRYSPYLHGDEFINDDEEEV